MKKLKNKSNLKYHIASFFFTLHFNYWLVSGKDSNSMAIVWLGLGKKDKLVN